MSCSVGYLLVPRQSLTNSQEHPPEGESHAEVSEQTEPQLRRARVEANGDNTTLLNKTINLSRSHSGLPVCEGNGELGKVLKRASVVPNESNRDGLLAADTIFLDILTLGALKTALQKYLCCAISCDGEAMHAGNPHNGEVSRTFLSSFESLVLVQEENIEEKEASPAAAHYVVWSFHFAWPTLGVGAVIRPVPLPRSVCVASPRLKLRVFQDQLACHPHPFACRVDRCFSPNPLHSKGRGPREGFEQPVLLVGAGGIGCELLKILVLGGFRWVEVVDLDTVDATNLNRQFLFTAEEVGLPKSVVARAAVLRWGEERQRRFGSLWGRNGETSAPASATALTPPTLVAYHADIKDPRFDVHFFSRFSAVLNALDNVSARQHVNRLCMQANVPLIESGSMGYNGQVQVIAKGRYECYDCYPRPAGQKTFAVCTIHARPTNMVHCVHFAKELYETLFGDNSFLREACGPPSRERTIQCSSPESSEPGETTEVSLQDGEAAAVEGATGTVSPVLEPVREEKGGNLGYLREALFSWWASVAPQVNSISTNAEGTINDSDALRLHHLGERLLQQMYHHKIQELLSVKSSWPTTPPLPLGESFIHDACALFGVADIKIAAMTPAQSLCELPLSAGSISRDSILSTTDSIRLFLSACARCAHRLWVGMRAKAQHTTASGKGSNRTEKALFDDEEAIFMGFRKEDDAAVDFVAAAANLRAHVFHIPVQSVEALRTIAGAIVPAIATTNAIVAAGAVQQMCCLLGLSSQEGPSNSRVDGRSECQNIYIRKVPQLRRRRLHLQPPTPGLETSFISSFPSLVGPTDENNHYHGEGNVEKKAWRMDNYLVHTAEPRAPNPDCLVCQRHVPEVHIVLDMESTTLGVFTKQLLEGVLGFEAPSVACDGRFIYEDSDYEDLSESPLCRFTRSKVCMDLGSSERFSSKASLPNTVARDEDLADITAGGSTDCVGGYMPLVMLVDGMNKEVEWQVVVEHSCHSTGTPTNMHGGPPNSGLAFCLQNLEEAKVCEAAALARLKQKRVDEAKKQDEEQASNHVVPVSPPPGCAVDVDESGDEEANTGDTRHDSSADVIELD